MDSREFEREKMTDAIATDSTGHANSSSNSAETKQSDSIPASTQSTVRDVDTVREPHNGEKSTKKGKRPTGK